MPPRPARHLSFLCNFASLCAFFIFDASYFPSDLTCFLLNGLIHTVEPKRAALKSAALHLNPVLAEFQRKNIRLPADYYLGRKFYFLTLCFESRRRFGANPRVASWLIAHLQKHSVTRGFFVHAYCLMPDHLHILASAASNESNLMAFVESFKQETAHEFARRARRDLWQFKYYDRILRGSDSPESVAWYIWLNPVRKGLCRAPAEYPFLGSFTEVGKRLLKGSAAPEWAPPWKKKD